MENNKFGGNVSQERLTEIFKNRSKEHELLYSHKKENRWNMWLKDSGLTLSFVLNNGLFIPSVSVIVRQTFEKFYSSNEADVDSWVRYNIKQYFEALKKELERIEIQEEIDGYQAYLESYYESLRKIDEYYEEHGPLVEIIEVDPNETECQRYNREHDEYLTEEEYKLMFPDCPEEKEESVKKLVKTRKANRDRIKERKKQVPGQLSFDDLLGGDFTDE